MLERISLTIDRRLLEKVDSLVDGEANKNRSQTISALLRKALRGKGVEKALVLAGKKNFLLEKILPWLKKNGIEEVVIAGGQNDSVLNRIKDGKAFGLSIEYSWDENKGTAFALKKAQALLKEPFLLCYSDVFCEDLNLKDLLSFHDSHKNSCTLVLTSSKHPSRFGVAKLLGVKITDFEEKPASAEGFLINAGVAVCNPTVFSFLEGQSSFEKNILPVLAKQGQLFGYVYYGKWVH